MVKCRLPWTVGLAVLVGAPGVGLPAQTSTPAFDVASIKPSGPTPTFAAGSPDRFVRRFITLSLLLVNAYDVSEFQIQGGPDWVRTTRFDVEAKAESRASPEQMRLMVRRLLAERFALTVHTESRDLPRYALVKARNDGKLGEKLRPSALDCPAIIAARGADYRPPSGQTGPPPCVIGLRMTGGVRTLVAEGIPISQLLRFIQLDAGRVVVDKTGLTGTWDFELQSEQPNLPGLPSPPGQPSAPAEGFSLFTALQEQLGLKLESERGPVDVLVIDHVERPKED
jgi:uncharacterized protein (TIGR03435 family)